jgi:anti-sigma factor ChrR (cupin superfamily)
MRIDLPAGSRYGACDLRCCGRRVRAEACGGLPSPRRPQVSEHAGACTHCAHARTRRARIGARTHAHTAHARAHVRTHSDASRVDDLLVT